MPASHTYPTSFRDRPARSAPLLLLPGRSASPAFALPLTCGTIRLPACSERPRVESPARGATHQGSSHERQAKARNGPEPRYHQIAAQLAQRIVAGAYTQGARLAERDLAAEYAVSRFTVRDALRVLETQGLVHRVPRQGTFVAASLPETRWASTATTIRLAFVASETLHQ